MDLIITDMALTLLLVTLLSLSDCTSSASSNWEVEDEASHCLLLSGHLVVQVGGAERVAVPGKAAAAGDCGQEESWVTLDWAGGQVRLQFSRRGRLAALTGAAARLGGQQRQASLDWDQPGTLVWPLR